MRAHAVRIKTDATAQPIFVFSVVFAVYVIRKHLGPPVIPYLLASIYIQGLGAVTAPCGYDDDPNNINYHHERLWDIATGEIARCTAMQASGLRALAINPS